MIEDIGDALDLLSEAQDLLSLIEMAVHHKPNDDAKGIAAGAYVASQRLEQARAGLHNLWRPDTAQINLK